MPEAFVSPEDCIRLLPPRGLMTIVLPDAVDGHPFVSGLAAAASGGRHHAGARAGGGAVLSLQGMTSSAGAFKSLPDVSTGTLIVLDLTGQIPAWASNGRRFRRFLSTLLPVLRRKKCSAMVVLPDRLFSSELQSLLFSSSAVVAGVFSAGPWLYFQVIKAPRAGDPELKLPRLLKLQESGFRLAAPYLPIPGREHGVDDALLDTYRRAFDEAGEGMVLFDPRGPYRAANRRALEILGIGKEDLASRVLRDFVPPEEYVHVLRLLLALPQRRRITDQIRVLRSGKDEIDVSVTATHLHARLDSVILREVSLPRSDGSGRAHLEEAARRFAVSPVPQAVFLGRKLSDANSAFRDLFASSLAVNPNPTLQHLLGRELTESARALLQVGEPKSPTERILSNVTIPGHDGARKSVDLLASRVHIGARNGAMITVVEHTTRDHRIHELERALHATRAVADNRISPAIVVRDDRILWVNRAFAALVGREDPEGLIGSPVEGMLVPRDRRAAPGRLAAVGLEPEQCEAFECSFLSFAGKPLRVEAMIQRIDYEGGTAGLAVLRNVTGKLKSTEELRERLDEQHRLHKILGAAKGELDPLLCARELFAAGMKQLGFTAGICYLVSQDGSQLRVVEAEGIPEGAMSTLSVQSLQEGITGYVARTLAPLHLQLEHYPPHLPYKVLFEGAGLHTSIYLPLSADGALYGIILFCSVKTIDPSELTPEFLETLSHEGGKLLGVAGRFAQLTEAERQARQILESVPDVTYERAGDGSFLFLSDRVETLLGHKREEFLRNPDLWRQCVHPDDRSIYSSRMGEMGKGRSFGEVWYRVLPKGKAEAKKVRDAFSYTVNEEGALVCTRGVVSAETPPERESLTGTGAQALPQFPGGGVHISDIDGIMTDVIDKMGDAFIITDLQGRVAEVNMEFTRLTGFTRQEAIGMQMPYPWLLDEEYGTVMRWINALREKLALRDFDMNWVSRDGVRMAISLNTSLLRNASGEPYAMLNIARNITERKMLADSLSRTNRRVEMLNRIVSAANATLDISSIFGVVAREIISMVPCDVVALDLLADDRRSMEVRACHVTGEASAAYVGKVSPVEGTSAQRVIETREPVLFNEIPESGDILPAYAAEFASFLSIPVILNERVMGTLDLASREKAMFAPDDLALLQPIADQVGAAVQNALLYAQIQAQVERVHALYKVGESLAGAPDTEQVLQVIAEEMHHSLSYDRFVYAGMTPDGTLHVSRAFGVEGGDLVSDELVENDHRWLDHKEGVHAGDGTTPSMVTVSVRGKDRLHGVICLSRNAATPFEDADLRLAQSIATLAGIALDRVLLYEETLAKAEEIEARNRDLDDFTYVVSHDLKEPLITIEGYSSIVQQEFADTLDAEAVDYLRSIVQATERLKRLIDDLLTLSRVGRARHELEVVNAQDVLGAVIRDLEFTIRETHAVVLIPEPLPPVVYDSTQLGLVFRNLISNGIKFNTSDTPTVTVSFRESPDHHVFCIADNGIGIPDEYFGKIFVIFQRLHSAESFPGTGAGLTIVKKIVERHGGRIWVESEVGRGTYFYFSVPRHLTTTGT